MLVTKARFHVFTPQMEGRRHDVARALVAKLDDVLAEVRLHRVYPVGAEMRVQLDFFCHHGFALGDRPRAALFQNRGDDIAGFRGIAGPMDVPAGALNLRFELDEQFIETRQRSLAYGASLFAQGFEREGKRREGSRAPDLEAFLQMGEGALKPDIMERRTCGLGKIARIGGH